ncbi:AMP-binding protein [Nakamurella lactea]|uniref:AMP-binding protein n=1 Tax=Nakamurella lactea TaxID=459515 RepID=UPI00048FFCBC|nr:AMP-binding protein [Nakamurella lactea]
MTALTDMPTRDECVIRNLIDTRAAEAPDEVFAVFDGTGEQWTNAELLRRTRSVAAGLHELGIRPGDLVAVWLPNGPAALVAYTAISYLGAVYTPFNTAYRGGLLEHVIENSGASVLIADSRLLDRLASVEHGGLHTVIAIGESPAVEGIRVLPEAALDGDPDALTGLEQPIEPWDRHCVMYTSGTTGPSKGVVTTYLQGYTGITAIPTRRGARMMLVGPMFHTSGAAVVHNSLINGGSLVMLESFSTQSFWADVRRYRITSGVLVGAMATFLLKQPEAADDRDHGLDQVVMMPLSDDPRAFADRFGVDIYTCFNMTETPTPIVSEVNPPIPGIAGRIRPGLQARLVDGNDLEVADGQTGELILRSDLPWALATGYHNNSEATAALWRNGWLHTGDALRRDAEGNYYFVDRLKDAIRRRGENVSSFEVEKELQAHPGVRLAAVVAVPSEHGEDEVLAVIAPVTGAQLDFVEIITFLRDRMAHFMIPRYLRIVDALPATPTNKVEKYRLRADGVTPDTWDREAAGISIKRDRL